jgi:hypothetical protein
LRPETVNPFAKGFHLTPDHESWQPFSHQQLQHPGHKESGYYSIPGPYLGYKLNKSPKVYLHRVDIPEDVMFNKASMLDPDTLTWEQAMSEPAENIEKWLDAANKEIKALEGKETWEEVPLSTLTVKVIPGTWVFRHKRDPQGNVTKWKARWVLRGDLQDVDFDTYASVVLNPSHPLASARMGHQGPRL